MASKISIRELLRQKLKFEVDENEKTLFDFSKASGVKVNAVRRLYNQGEATIQTVETLLEHFSITSAEAFSQYGTLHAVELLVHSDESLTPLQKHVIFSFF